MNNPKWQYNELKLCGVKFDNGKFAEKYDKHHQKFRDYKKETEELIKVLDLDAQSTIIDMGCGTGAFSIHAADSFKKIFAVDVSKSMMKHAIKKARETGKDNIEFHHGGFLTYKHLTEPVDAIVSILALHHLPDFWKLLALKRLIKMLKAGGKFYLSDVIFSFEHTQYESCIEAFIKSLADRMGAEMKQELETHFRQEYSTFDWVMEGMLEEAGFIIEKADYKEGFFATYLCKKKAE